MKNLQEGVFSEGGVSTERFSNRWYNLLDLSLVISEYENKQNTETFLKDLKNAIQEFQKRFTFLKYNKIWINKELFTIENSWVNSNENVDIAQYLSNFDVKKLYSIFNDDLGEHILNISTIALFQNHEKNDIEIENNSSLIFVFKNQGKKSKLVLCLIWDFGAEWFYNEFKENNKALVRNAILGFYESNLKYKELNIDYYLFGFDLELGKFTEKEIIVNQKLAQPVCP